jgi:hypothetical protein
LLLHSPAGTLKTRTKKKGKEEVSLVLRHHSPITPKQRNKENEEKKKTQHKITLNCQRRELLVFQHSFQNVFEFVACSIFFVVETKKKRMGEVRKQKKRKMKRRVFDENEKQTNNSQKEKRSFES